MRLVLSRGLMLILTIIIVFFADKETMYDEHRGLTYNQVIARDAKRFDTADRNGDKKLDRTEYADFLHPGNHTHREERHSADCNHRDVMLYAWVGLTVGEGGAHSCC